MNDAAESQENRPGRLGPSLVAWIGLLVVFTGAVTYFLFFVHFPALRDFPWVNLPVVVLGLLISGRGWRRACVDKGRSLFSRALASVPFFLSLAISGLFGAYIFFLSYQLPETDGVVQVSQAAPDFALPDQREQTVRLSGLRGKKVVLDFYRGHW